MAVGLEARIPFMDHELAAWVARLPLRFPVARSTGNGCCVNVSRGLFAAPDLERKKWPSRAESTNSALGRCGVPPSHHLRASIRAPPGNYRTAGAAVVCSTTSRGLVNHEKLLWSLCSYLRA